MRAMKPIVLVGLVGAFASLAAAASGQAVVSPGAGATLSSDGKTCLSSESNDCFLLQAPDCTELSFTRTCCCHNVLGEEPNCVCIDYWSSCESIGCEDANGSS